MPTAQPEKLVTNSKVTETPTGISVVERYLVTGLDPASPCPLFDALHADGLPTYHQPHGYVPNIYVRQRVPVPRLNSKTEAYVDITSQPLDSDALDDTPTVRFQAIARQKESSRDYAGNIVTVDYAVGGNPANARPTQIGRYVQTAPMGLLTFSWQTGRDPTYLLSYFGRISDSPWRGGAKATWQMVDLGIDKILYRTNWQISCGFLYDPDTHIKTLFYRIDDGYIPADIDPVDITKERGNGWTNVQGAGLVNFNTLGLPTGF